MQSTDLQVFRALANGRSSNNRVNSGVVGNVFPHVKTKQLVTGIAGRFEKLFWTLQNVDNLPLLDPESYIDKPSASAFEYIVKQIVGQRDTLADIEANWPTGNCYGSAVIKNPVTAGATSLVVTVKGEAMLPAGVDEIFRDAETIRLCSHTSAITGDGSEEDLVISGTPVASGLDITINLLTAVVGNYSAGDRVSSLISLGAELKPTYTTPVVTSTAGSVNEADFPPVLDNIGTPEEDITITLTSATAFDCGGDTAGAIGSGTVSVEFAPVDAIKGRPLFTLPAGFFTGTFAAGDTVTFTLHPAQVAVAEKQVVLPNATSLQNNSTALVFGGEVAA